MWIEDKNGGLINLDNATLVDLIRAGKNNFIIRIHFAAGADVPQYRDIRYRTKPGAEAALAAIKAALEL